MLSDYNVYQILRDGTTATYNSLLNIETTPNELVGIYTCSVLNSAGQSNVEQVIIQGMLMILGTKEGMSQNRGLCSL